MAVICAEAITGSHLQIGLCFKHPDSLKKIYYPCFHPDCFIH